MKKNILYITPWCPYPPHKNGGVHTTYNIIINKPDNIDMDLLYFENRDIEAENELSKYVNNIFYNKMMVEAGILRKIIMLISGKPNLLADIDVSKFNISLDITKYDVIVYDQIYSTALLNILKSKKTNIVMMHDNHVLMYSRKAQVDSCIIKRIFDRFQINRLKKWDERILPYIDKLIYVSKLDCDVACQENIKWADKITYFSLGVSMPNEMDLCRPSNPHSLVFSGVMDYGPNEDAAAFFASEVFPKILEMYPDATFVIAGKNPTKNIIKLACKNIIVTGFVQDMARTITNSAVYISPLRIGSGMKNKVLEAMAAGMPVLLSPISRDGIEGLVDKENCLFVDENEWAEKIDEIFKDAKLRGSIAENGKRYVEENHSWKNVFENFMV